MILCYNTLMTKFFSPQSIAIIGASAKKEKIGGIILDNLLSLKYSGKIFPVNPKYTHLKHLRCYNSLLEIKEPIDLGIIAIPAALVPQILTDCARRKNPLKNIIIISAGFAETGPAGKQLEDKIASLAEKHHLQIIGPNCLGLINPWQNLNASFAPNNFAKGDIAFISQSGAFVSALFDLSSEENFGFSSVVTIGNKTVLDETDFLEYFIKDKKTQVIALYLESIKRGREFISLINAASRHKPIIILKSGNSKATASAIASHTGALAGDVGIIETAIKDNGGIYCSDLTDFVSTLKMISHFKKPLNNKIVVLTNAGGPGVITTDLVSRNEKLELFKFTENQKQALQKILPPAAAFENPIDLLGDADSQLYETVFKKLKKMPGIGALLSIITLQSQTNLEAIVKLIIRLAKNYPWPIIPIIIGNKSNYEIIKKFKKENFVNFIYPSAAIQALANYYLYSKINFPNFTQKISYRSSPFRQLFTKAKNQERPALYYSEIETIAKKYNLPLLPSLDAQKTKLEKISYPAVLKIDDPSILHKNKKDGLVLNIKNAPGLRQAIARLKNKFPSSNIIIQKQVDPGVELIMGLKTDENFGPVLLFGLGGITAEIIAETMLWILPSSPDIIKEKISTSKISRILTKQKINLDSVVAELLKVSRLALENPDIKELDINPIIFYPDKKPVIVDFKIILA
jgi:acetate---CoA ligase (ADP-forming)